MYVAVDKFSKMMFAGRMHGYTEEHFISAMNDLKARVRTMHGEIETLRGDSHPTHKATGVRSYMSKEQHGLQLSPP